MMKQLGLGTVLLAGWLLAACTPTVALKAPEDPITINLNVKIDHEIRLKVEKISISYSAKTATCFKERL